MMDHEKIEKQAKQIMENFLKEIGTVENLDKFGIEREAQMRTPKKTESDETFRQAFLANAPKTRDGLLIMERKQW